MRIGRSTSTVIARDTKPTSEARTADGAFNVSAVTGFFEPPDGPAAFLFSRISSSQNVIHGVLKRQRRAFPRPCLQPTPPFDWPLHSFLPAKFPADSSESARQ